MEKGHRPMTLVLAKDRSLKSIQEARKTRKAAIRSSQNGSPGLTAVKAFSAMISKKSKPRLQSLKMSGMLP